MRDVYKEGGLLAVGLTLLGMGISAGVNTLEGAILYGTGVLLIVLKEFLVKTKE